MRLEPPSWWYKGKIPVAAWGLWPIAAVYGSAVERRFRTTVPYRSALPVICVGNLTVGGAGKTPMALKIASLLRDGGRNLAFLTRGYGGSERGPHIVDAAADGADRVGDEPLLLARAAAVAVSRNRPAGAKLLETLGSDVIVMDDGFQNPSLEKDFSLVVVDAGAGAGCGHVFPLGPLRAKLGFQLAMADAVAILGGQEHSAFAARIERERRQAGLAALPILHARIAPLITDEMRERRFLAFCGIGRPGKFFETLARAGVAVVKSRAFPDHHPYTEADARSLLAEAKLLEAGLVTTEKDAVRLKGKAGLLAELERLALAMPIAVEFEAGGEERLREAIFDRLSCRV